MMDAVARIKRPASRPIDAERGVVAACQRAQLVAHGRRAQRGERVHRVGQNSRRHNGRKPAEKWDRTF
jgi:hypothetical protein